MLEILRKNMNSDSIDSLMFAVRASRDLDLFDSYFKNEIDFIEKNFDSSVKTVRFSIRDFGAKGDGSANDAPAFNAAIQKIRKLNGIKAELFFPKGIYRFDDLHQNTFIANPYKSGTDYRLGGNFAKGHLVLNGLNNLTLRGETADTVLIGSQRSYLLQIFGCNHVTVKDLTFRYRDETSMQGTIEELDDQNHFLIMKVDPLSPTPEDKDWESIDFSCAQGYGPDGVLLRQASDIYWFKKYESLGNRRYKLFYREGGPKKSARPGIRIAFPLRNNNASAIMVLLSRFCSFENVTLNNSNAAGYIVNRSYNTSFIQCRLVPLPGRLMSSAADAFFSTDNIFGHYLKDCLFDRMGDDGINVLGYSRPLFFARDNKIITDPGRRLYDRQDLRLPLKNTIELKGNQYFYSVDSVTGRINGEGRIKTINKLFTGYHRELAEFEIDGNMKNARSLQTLDPDVPLNKLDSQKIRPIDADHLYCYHESGIGTVISNCQYNNNRNSSLVLQTSCALVENCRLANSSTWGLRLGAYTNQQKWKEAPPPYCVTFRNCVIENCRAGIVTNHLLKNGPADNCPIRFIRFKNNNIFHCEKAMLLENLAYAEFEKTSFINNGSANVGLADKIIMKNTSWNGAPFTLKNIDFQFLLIKKNFQLQK